MNFDISVRKTYFFRGRRRESQPGDTVVLAGIISSVCKTSRHCLCRRFRSCHMTEVLRIIMTSLIIVLQARPISFMAGYWPRFLPSRHMTRKSRNMQVEILSTGYQPKINVIITSICDINNFKSYCHYKITSDLRQANNVTK